MCRNPDLAAEQKQRVIDACEQVKKAVGDGDLADSPAMRSVVDLLHELAAYIRASAA